MPSYTAGDVMDRAAVLLNDSAKRLYSYTIQLPYLRSAQEELDQEFNANEIQTNLISEIVIPVVAGAISLSLPVSFFLPISLQERKTGEISFSDMSEVKNVLDLDQTANSSLAVWDYRHNCVNFIAANQDRDVRLFYWRTLPDIIDDTSDEPMKGAKNALAFRTAALCAEFAGGGNETRALSLNIQASMATDRLISLYTKNNQGKRVRRKPFRVGLYR